MVHDPVNHPSHYTSHPSGVECITVTEHMSFNVGNAIKYLWRAGQKGAQLQDLEKARWYVDREIKRLAPKEVKQDEPDPLRDAERFTSLVGKQSLRVTNMKECNRCGRITYYSCSSPLPPTCECGAAL